MKEHMDCSIIAFKEGEFFNGVKGKVVRKTKHFKDAKIIKGKIEDRDAKFLDGLNYKIVKASFTCEYGEEESEGEL